jgi:RHS repeat-associated protein
VFAYDAGGQLIAEYSTQAPQTHKVSYLTTDHLGSPRIVTDQNGAVISRKDFAAFGDEVFTPQRTGGPSGNGYDPPNVRQDYTGYQKDGESGLEYAQARYYNVGHGRFTSVDPLTASATIRDPQTLNRYSYSLNSPYKFSDPLGLFPLGGSGCSRCYHVVGDNWWTDNDVRPATLRSAPAQMQESQQSSTPAVADEHEVLHADQSASPPQPTAEQNVSAQPQSQLPQGTLQEATVLVAYGEPGEGRHDQGGNFRRAAETRAEQLRAQGYNVPDIISVASVDGFQNILDEAADPDNHIIEIDLFAHGAFNSVYLGDITSGHNKITMDNVTSIFNHSATLRAITIYACYTADSDNGISAALAKQLRIDVLAIKGPTIFSTDPTKITTRGNLPDKGPAYLIPDGGYWRKFPLK